MSNVRTLKDIKDGGHWLGSTYEQELEKKLRSTIDYNSKIIDYNENQLNASSTELRSKFISERRSRIELEAKHSAEVKSLKSNIKSLKRERTLAQKASSANKIQILSLEAKIREFEGKLEDIDLERTYHNLDVMGGVIEDPVQISSSDPKEIDSLRLELERANEDRNSKEYTIECMEKGIEATYEITSREIDALYSARSNLMEENRSLRDQLVSKKNTSSQIISSEGIPLELGGAEAVPLSQEIPLAPVIVIVITSSLISPMVTYSILALLLIAVIWLVGRKYWNSWKKSNIEYSPNRNHFLSSSGISEAGLYDRRPEVRR
ncbi:unnamed protein product [Rhizophagus irregularis]|nr:unnamed protein product [Rhizophagus irregularis]